MLQLSPGPGRGRSRSLGGRGPDPPRPRPPGTASWRSPAWPDTSSSAGSRTRTAADPRALKILSNQGQEIFFNGANIFLACDGSVRKYICIQTFSVWLAVLCVAVARFVDVSTITTPKWQSFYLPYLEMAALPRLSRTSGPLSSGTPHPPSASTPG